MLMDEMHAPEEDGEGREGDGEEDEDGGEEGDGGEEEDEGEGEEDSQYDEVSSVQLYQRVCSEPLTPHTSLAVACTPPPVLCL